MKGKIIVSVLTLFLLSACNEDQDPAAGDVGNAKAVLITTQKAQLMDLPIWLETVGRVHSMFAPTLAAEVEGRITMVIADTGDRVALGQLLAETDNTTLLLQKQAASAGLERLKVHINNGQRRVDRFEKLTAKNLSSQTQLDDAREQLEAYTADYKAAEAQFAIVNDSLAKSRIVAPVPGVIQRRFITKGDFVKRGDTLFEITHPERLQAWLPFPETVAMQVRVGQPVRIYSPLTPGEVILGEISELQPSVGLGSRAIMAIIDLDDPGNLRPDATLTGKALVETRKQTVMVPKISVVRRPVGEVVYIIVGNKAVARRVTTGHQKDELIEITLGLDGDETLATDGAAFLTDGAAVKFVGPVN